MLVPALVAGGVAVLTFALSEPNPIVVGGAVAFAMVVFGIRQRRLRQWWWAAGTAATMVLAADVAVDRSWLMVVPALLAVLLLEWSTAAEAREWRAPARGVVLLLAVLAATAAMTGSRRDTEIGSLVLVAAAMVATAAAHQRPPRPVLVSVGPTAIAGARLRHGRTHISSYTAAPDKRAIALPGGAVVAFRVCMGVAVTSGDPLSDQATQSDAIAEFVALCDAHGWLPCVYQADSQLRASYRAAGLRLVKFGEEAVVELGGSR